MFSPPPFRKFRDSLAPHASLRGRQTFGQVPAPAPFRGRCSRLRIPIASMSGAALNRPGTVRFRDLLSEEECAAASRFPPRSWRNGTGRPTAGCALRAVPLSGYRPKRSGSARSDAKPRRARFAALQPGAFGFAGPARRAPRRPGRRGRRTRAPSARGHAHRLPLVLGPRIRWIAASDDRDRAFLRCWVCREAFPQGHGRRPWAASGQLRAPPMRRYAPSGRGGPRGMHSPCRPRRRRGLRNPFFLHADTRRFHAVHVFTEIRHRPRRPARRPAHPPRLGLGAHRQGMWRSRRIRWTPAVPPTCLWR